MTTNIARAELQRRLLPSNAAFQPLAARHEILSGRTWPVGCKRLLGRADAKQKPTFAERLYNDDSDYALCERAAWDAEVQMSSLD